MKRKNIVISYKNPDTDGVACSIGMAILMTNTDEKWEPVILGELGKETQYVLNQANISYPQDIGSFCDVNKIVLVDTHHKSQLPEDFPFEKVVMIIDHHPKGDDIFPNAEIIDKKMYDRYVLDEESNYIFCRNNEKLVGFCSYRILK